MSTVLIVTILVIIFLVIFIIIGWCRGFLRMILAMLSLLATLVIAAFLLTPVSTFLSEHTEIEKSIGKGIETSLGWNRKEAPEDNKKEKDKQKTAAFDLTGIIEALRAAGIDVPDDITMEQITEFVTAAERSENINERDRANIEDAVIESLRMPEIIKNIVISKKNAGEYIRLGVDSFQQYVVKSLSVIVLKILTYIALVIVIFVIIRLLLLISKAVNHIPILGGINRFFGAVVGFIEAALILWLLCLIISLIANSEFGAQVVDVIEQSKFLSYLYEENLVLRLVNSFFALF